MKRKHWPKSKKVLIKKKMLVVTLSDLSFCKMYYRD